MLISSKEFCSQEDILTELIREGFEVTQATLSRDMKLLKIAKASSMNGKYVYVLPNAIAYNIDNSNIIEILGTIAGDDTIVTILAEGADRGRLERKLMQVIPNLI